MMPEAICYLLRCLKLLQMENEVISVSLALLLFYKQQHLKTMIQDEGASLLHATEPKIKLLSQSIRNVKPNNAHNLHLLNPSSSDEISTYGRFICRFNF